MLGAKATVFMPEGAPIVKEKATRAYGADVRFAGASVDESLVAAGEFAAETGAVLIHPFDHPDIVAGQGTVGLEILHECPDVRTVVPSTDCTVVPSRMVPGASVSASCAGMAPIPACAYNVAAQLLA